MKYFRTQHGKISLGATSDDKFMSDAELDSFIGQDVVLTEKLDGQNNCFNEHGLFARSHSMPTKNAWDKPLIPVWQSIQEDLKSFGIALYGESMVAIHSIEYQKLQSFFYVFGVLKDNKWLSWEKVEYYASLFDFPTVPVIAKTKYNGDLAQWLNNQLGMKWTDYIQTGGSLSGMDNEKPACEGFIIRKANDFYAGQENTHIFKLVRPNHIQTNKDWKRTWRKHQICYE